MGNFPVAAGTTQPIGTGGRARTWRRPERQITGPLIEKAVAPLRSFIAEPMRWQRLSVAGDAAHIVPPKVAKGLNLAASDVHYLSAALIAHHLAGTDGGLDDYMAESA